ncbi:hypothetical protein BC833DRAFT_567660 [Globomyces pollinis-pini]|nr:hypothetical protein BC833DRAFT_567660 [Globomyces pollinis-pini]
MIIHIDDDTDEPNTIPIETKEIIISQLYRSLCHVNHHLSMWCPIGNFPNLSSFVKLFIYNDVLNMIDMKKMFHSNLTIVDSVTDLHTNNLVTTSSTITNKLPTTLKTRLKTPWLTCVMKSMFRKPKSVMVEINNTEKLRRQMREEGFWKKVLPE